MRTMTSILAVTMAAAIATLASASVQADDNAMAEKFAADRLAAFGQGDAGAIIAQYAENATVVTPSGVLKGRAQIKGMIDAIVAEFAQPGVKFELLSQQAIGPIVAFTWTAETKVNTYDLGAETYVVENGRAVYQTFAAKVAPR